MTCSPQYSEPQTQRVAVSESSSSARKGASLSAPGSRKVSSVMRVPSNSISSNKPSQESATASGSDPKLVEMINSVIVDRSPSVKWEDIGEKPKFYPLHCLLPLYNDLLNILILNLVFLQLALKRQSKLF